MTDQNNARTETVSISEKLKAVTPAQIGSMTRKINESVARRDEFEKQQGLSLADTSSSWYKAKAKIEKGKSAFARYCVAMNIEPRNIIERKLFSHKMYNAKGLVKVIEATQLACGNTETMQKVTQAFIACAIVASDSGHNVISNDVNVNFINSRSFDSLLRDDLAQALDDFRMKSMTSGAPTQSSQVRNMLDALQVGEIGQINRPRDCISLNLDHGFIDLMRERLLK